MYQINWLNMHSFSLLLGGHFSDRPSTHTETSVTHTFNGQHTERHSRTQTVIEHISHVAFPGAGGRMCVHLLYTHCCMWCTQKHTHTHTKHVCTHMLYSVVIKHGCGPFCITSLYYHDHWCPTTHFLHTRNPHQAATLTMLRLAISYVISEPT